MKQTIPAAAPRPDLTEPDITLPIGPTPAVAAGAGPAEPDITLHIGRPPASCPAPARLNLT